MSVEKMPQNHNRIRERESIKAKTKSNQREEKVEELFTVKQQHTNSLLEKVPFSTDNHGISTKMVLKV